MGHCGWTGLAFLKLCEGGGQKLTYDVCVSVWVGGEAWEYDYLDRGRGSGCGGCGEGLVS